MDEYERIEEELSQVYASYVVKIRCLAFLEEQLEELEKAQKMEFAVSGLFESLFSKRNMLLKIVPVYLTMAFCRDEWAPIACNFVEDRALYAYKK